jgi:hypothetical protein
VTDGLRADIDYCAQIDRFDCDPQLDLERWTIRVP